MLGMLAIHLLSLLCKMFSNEQENVCDMSLEHVKDSDMWDTQAVELNVPLRASMLNIVPATVAGIMADSLHTLKTFLQDQDKGVSVQDKIPACIGESVLVACRCPSSTVGIEWSRPEPRRVVCFYRDGRSDPDAQHPSYKGRADCGNGILHLKNVRHSDMGLYQCQCFRGGGKGSHRHSRNIRLCDRLAPQGTPAVDEPTGNSTTDPPSKYNTTQIILAAILVAVVAVVIAAVIWYRCQAE